MTYPNGRKIDYVYNTGLDATISRLSAMADDNAGSPGTTLEAYVYLGLNTIVERDHPELNVNLTYIQQSGQSNTDRRGRYLHRPGPVRPGDRSELVKRVHEKRNRLVPVRL